MTADTIAQSRVADFVAILEAATADAKSLLDRIECASVTPSEACRTIAEIVKTIQQDVR